MSARRWIALPAAALLLTAGATVGAAPRRTLPETRVAMRHIRLFQFDDAASSIDYLEGTMAPTRSGRIIDLNDVGSFAIRVRRARVVVPAATMAALMNRHVLPAAGVAIRDARVRFAGDTIILDGKVRKAGLPLGFSATALAEVTPAGDLRLHVVRLKAAGLLPKKLLDGLGLGMPALLKSRNPKVLRIDRDAITIPIDAVFPAPVMSGRLSSVRVGNAGLVATIGAPASAGRHAADESPIMTLSGGTIRFAHILMPDARLAIRPMHKEAQFPFSPQHYYAQMVGGYSRATPAYGLIGYFADFKEK